MCWEKEDLIFRIFWEGFCESYAKPIVGKEAKIICIAFEERSNREEKVVLSGLSLLAWVFDIFLT